MFTYIGTPYDMGYAQGELMRDKAQQMINAVWMYLEEQVVSIVQIYKEMSTNALLHYRSRPSMVQSTYFPNGF